MAKKNPLAGGFLLTVAILAGFGWGLATGQPSIGLLAGIALGIAAAVALWLIDRRGRG